jgi:hypothetical protein
VLPLNDLPFAKASIKQKSACLLFFQKTKHKICYFPDFVYLSLKFPGFMKKLLIVIPLLLLTSCTSVREQQGTDPVILLKHPQPLKIFTAGRWNENYTILTLVDAQNIYFTVMVKRNDSLKVGAIYTP